MNKHLGNFEEVLKLRQREPSPQSSWMEREASLNQFIVFGAQCRPVQSRVVVLRSCMRALSRSVVDGRRSEEGSKRETERECERPHSTTFMNTRPAQLQQDEAPKPRQS